MGLRFWRRNHFEPRRPDEDTAIVLDESPSIPSDESSSAEREKRAETEQELETLKRKHGALAERLANLERMLADPESGQNAILYYRLCAIWQMCSHNLELMAKRFSEKYEAQGAGGSEHSGLPVEKRRAINILLVAMAQEYYLLFSESQIAEMARQATLKPVESVHFGLAEECLEFSYKARELAARARSEDNFSDTLRRRAKYLHGCLRFNKNTCVPREDSLNSMPSRIGSQEKSLNDYSDIVPVNILALNYWNLQKVLLR